MFCTQMNVIFVQKLCTDPSLQCGRWLLGNFLCTHTHIHSWGGNQVSIERHRLGGRRNKSRLKMTTADSDGNDADHYHPCVYGGGNNWIRWFNRLMLRLLLHAWRQSKSINSLRSSTRFSTGRSGSMTKTQSFVLRALTCGWNGG